MVLYTTGRCKVGCFYCTLPKEENHNDRIAVNEIVIDPDSNVIAQIKEESQTCLATGAGVTGGDPLAAPDRTISFIQDLRQSYGEEYHIHLYTSGEYLNGQLLERLYNAGLDEIRFHPKELDQQQTMEKARMAKFTYPELVVGFEVPAIPGMEEKLRQIIYFADDNDLDFVNLNEFEFTEANFVELDQEGYNSVLYNSAVRGSASTSKDLIHSLVDETTVPIHFCSSASKDRIQLRNRFRRRASQVARPFDSISDEGELEYARLRVQDTPTLRRLRSVLQSTFEVPTELFEVVEKELIIETSWIIVEELINALREEFSTIEAEIICRHPLDDGPITWIDPL